MQGTLRREFSDSLTSVTPVAKEFSKMSLYLTLFDCLSIFVHQLYLVMSCCYVGTRNFIGKFVVTGLGISYKFTS